MSKGSSGGKGGGGKGGGKGGNWPSKSGNPSGGGRGNNPPKGSQRGVPPNMERRKGRPATHMVLFQSQMILDL
jgi:hypothetical protein